MKLDQTFCQLTELNFENRNKQYGAYWLRKRYHAHLIKSFAIAIVICALPLALIVFSNDYASIQAKAPVKDKVILVEQVYQMKPKPALPPAAAAPASVKSNHNHLVVVHDSVVSPKTDTTFTTFQKGSTAGATTDGDTAKGTATDTTNKTNGGDGLLASGDSTFLGALVDEAPSFPGGFDALEVYWEKNIKFTACAIEERVSGRVYVSFVVDKDGAISQVKVLKGIGCGMNEVVENAINKMPKWKPGKVKSKAVATLFTLPVRFDLR